MELNAKVSQQKKIIAALIAGEVPRRAFWYMGIANPTARCSELRKLGYGIKCYTEYTNGQKRTRYKLESMPDNKITRGVSND